MGFRSWLRTTKAERGLAEQRRTLEAQLDRLPADAPERGAFLNDLGNRWRDTFLRTGDPEHIENAIECYRGALAYAGKPGAGEDHIVSGNLAAGLVDRYLVSGDLADLESAIEAGRAAAAASEAGSPHQARYLTNLSHALHERFQRTRQRADVDEAVATGEEALQLMPAGTREAGIAALNLAAAVRSRAAPDDARRAVELLGQAVDELPPHSPEWGVARANLGIAQALAIGSSAEDLVDNDAAIDGLEDMARAAPPHSLTRTASLHAVGRARWAQYQRSGNRSQLDAAIAALQAAVDEAPEEAGDLPYYLNDLGIALSELTFTSDSAQGIAQALDAWVRALLLLEKRFGAIAMSYKLGQQTTSVELGLAERVMSAYLLLADRVVTGRDRMLRNAIWTGEATKTRVLTDLVGRGDLPDPAGTPGEVVARERAVVAELRALDTAALATYSRIDRVTGVEDGARRQALHEELDDLWHVIEASGDSGAAYVALRRQQPLTWDTIADLATAAGPSTALASMFSTNSRTLLFIVRASFEGPTVHEIDINREGWLDLMARFDREVRLGAGPAEETWDERLQPLLRGALPDLEGVERVVLAPAVWGVQLPWATVARRAGWRAPDGGAMPIVTVESFGLLHRLLARPRASGQGALVVGNPTGDLAHAEAEAVAIAAALGEEPLLRDAATRAAVTSALRAASIVHIAGHASFAAGDPLGSGIVLADGVLTAREIMADSIRPDLLVLSACETGVAEALGGNEFAGLSEAFHMAGVRCLLASLWKVDDPVTAVLMSRFYANWQAGSDLARALSDAMDAKDIDDAEPGEGRDRGRRDARPAVAPTGPPPTTYYWDSFVLSGDWSARPPTRA